MKFNVALLNLHACSLLATHVCLGTSFFKSCLPCFISYIIPISALLISYKPHAARKGRGGGMRNGAQCALIIKLICNWGAFAYLFAVEKQYYLFVCLCAHACVHTCVWVPRRVGVCRRVCAFNLACPSLDAYAPYCGVVCSFSGFTMSFTLSHKRHDFRNKFS